MVALLTTKLTTEDYIFMIKNRKNHKISVGRGKWDLKIHYYL